ncbi:RusA family crossover junction endodeoxyribonuclease [Clavibacter capsici]|uniref:RusA family crossover junction endodeoxyribonuclease n=1 Tax=Clavibacter capsici TaxID=1874630 RepID=UPI0014285E87|nr:RusA family crossover junction endodeoxyribonuclease [Clavibacter capsici]QIS38649.1 RusA family crossover junction endodeoxyribonuclease [Clavibacter capsici]
MTDTDELEVVEFTIPGTAIPQGSKTVFNGRAVEANKKLRPWRKVVTAAAVEALAGRPGFDTAVTAIIDFYLPRPRTVLRIRPTVKPDLDKLARGIGDGLTDSGLIRDDALIVCLSAAKWYADDAPYTRVKLRRLA